MTRRRNPGTLVAALAIALVALVGGWCGPPGGGSGDPENPVASLRVAQDTLYHLGGGGYLLRVAVIVTTTLPFQAIDLTLGWNAPVFQQVTPRPDPDFDDDGQFFGEVELDLAARTAHFVDLRHGDPGPTGDVTVATTWLYAPTGGSVTIHVDGTLATDAGIPFAFISNQAFTFPVTP